MLIAERAALLSGRDDEFVALITKGYTGMRWGELVGLETRFVRPTALRVEWQLYERGNGEFVRCPPKDESRRDVDLPGWLSTMLRQHLADTKPAPCPCHGKTYVFRSFAPANGAIRAPGPRLADVARRAEVSAGTVSNVLNRPEAVAEPTRMRVEQAMADLGYVRGGPVATTAPHWRRNGFATWVFQPAATGLYPAKAPQPERAVPIFGEPYPGIPARGRNSTARADACWTPIAPGLVPHGLRHSHRTAMQELMIAPKLMDARLGHADGSIGALYTHVTPAMRAALMDGLTGLWSAALIARQAMAPTSPVAILDRFLREAG